MLDRVDELILDRIEDLYRELADVKSLRVTWIVCLTVLDTC